MGTTWLDRVDRAGRVAQEGQVLQGFRIRRQWQHLLDSQTWGLAVHNYITIMSIPAVDLLEETKTLAVCFHRCDNACDKACLADY
jgi:hypothetical protein